MMAIGYIPLKEINPSIIDQQFLRDVESICFRCKFPYKLLGVNLDLTFLTGKCGCRYESDG